MTITLRPDQFNLKLGIYGGWETGKSNMLAVLPTGGGKSIVMSDIILDKYQLGYRQIIMAHRTELVGQMSVHVGRRGIKHRIIAPKNVVRQVIEEHRREFNGYSFVNPTANCSVGGVDTILSRADELKEWAEQQEHWYIDEAHHVLRGNKWGKCVDLFPRALGLGVTATPERADGQGLGIHSDGVFHEMVQGPTIRELIDQGALCDYEIVIPESDFEVPDQVAPSGDYSPKKMREASEKSHIVGDVVKEYIKYAMGKRAIVFATDVETSNEISKNFNAQGIAAASVSAKTPPEVRADYIRRFRDGRLTVLVNVDLFGEGFDVPAVEVVIMARPTASLAVFLQQFGRVLRTMFGKQYGLVIDHVSNWKRHGFPDKPRLWTLDRREKRAKKEPDPEDIPLTVCKGCSRPYERFYTACPHCGLEPPIVTAVRNLEQIDGDLVLLDRAKLEELRKAAELPSPADVAQRTAHVAGGGAGVIAARQQIERIQAQQKLEATINQWAGIQRAKGRSDRESHKRFFIATGVDVLTALAEPRAKMDGLTNTIEGWINNVTQNIS